MYDSGPAQWTRKLDLAISSGFLLRPGVVVRVQSAKKNDPKPSLKFDSQTLKAHIHHAESMQL